MNIRQGAQSHASRLCAACKQSAEHLRQAFKPNEAVWTLRCDNGSYRVRLVPDMAAEVDAIK